MQIILLSFMMLGLCCSLLPNELAPRPSNTPKSYVIISNLQSGSNIGSICRNSYAFYVSEVLVVGRKDFFGKMRGADRGAKFKQNFKNFVSTFEAAEYLKASDPTCRILGVEIADNAVSILDKPFTGSTAFIFGNEGGGLSPKQREICDGFVYIPQYNIAGNMASINVACASAIILQNFASWAKFEETNRNGEKFTNLA